MLYRFCCLFDLPLKSFKSVLSGRLLEQRATLCIPFNFKIFENVLTAGVKGRKEFSLPEDFMNFPGKTMTGQVEFPDPLKQYPSTTGVGEASQ